MAFELTDTAKKLSAQINKQIQVIVEIGGLGVLFGAIPVEKKFRYDDGKNYDEGNRYDSTVIDENSKAIIELTKTTNSITQQITPDKGGSTSLSVMTIAFVDKNSEMSELISFDNNGEILSKKCTVYLNYKGGSHREDSLPIFRGFIDGVSYESGLVLLSVSHPEKLKRQDVLTIASTELTAAMDASQTTADVKSTEQFIGSLDQSTLYIRIDDELMEVDNIISSTQFSVVRGQLNTLANSHDETEVSAFYRLQGNPLDVACKIMLSDEGNTFTTIEESAIGFNTNGSDTFNNSVIFEDIDIQDRLGLVDDDEFTISGSLSNDGTYTIADFGTFTGGSYITVDGTLNNETVDGVTFSYRSQFNVLPWGCQMLPNEVDVQGHVNIRDFQSANFTDYDFYIKDDISAKDFIDQEVYFPQGLYSIPRKARASVKLTQPPASNEVTQTVDESIATNLDKIKIKRSSDVYRYNEIVYNYNVDSIEDKFLRREILISATSKARVKAGAKQLKIESNGLRASAETDTMISRISDRLNDRYKFAASTIKGIQVNYGFGYSLEVGDVIPFGGSGVQLNNGDTGSRGLEIKLYEVINKVLNFKTGTVKLDLLETNFATSARYAVIGCASNINSGSTDTDLLVSDLFTDSDFTTQGEKWAPFVGERVQVRNDDWSEYAIRTLDSISLSNPNRLILDTALPFTPTDGHIIEPVDYDNTAAATDENYKIQFHHINATSEIIAVTDDKTFTVDDGTKVIVGSQIYVHAPDYATDSFGVDDVTVVDVSGNIVTLNKDLSITPSIGDLVESSNFADNGFPYLFI
jgi:hypothetical protein